MNETLTMDGFLCDSFEVKGAEKSAALKKYDEVKTGSQSSVDNIVDAVDFSKIQEHVESTTSLLANQKTSPYINIKRKTRSLTLKALAKKEDVLISERQKLILKSYSENLSRSEGVKLKYLTWQMDILEDAQNGEFLDELEAVVKYQEDLSKNIFENLDYIKTNFHRGRNRR